MPVFIAIPSLESRFRCGRSIARDLCLASRDSVHADAFAFFCRLFEPYLSVYQGEQGVIAAYSNVETSFDHGPALTHEDRASGHDRAFAALDAEALPGTVPAVARATDPLLMCHC